MFGSYFFVIFLFLIHLNLQYAYTNTLRSHSPIVIIGGGPTGMAAALMLEKNGFGNITIVEKRKPNEFESERAYLYLIDGRGQECTDSINITQKISSNAVSSYNFLNLTEHLVTGEFKTKSIPIVDKDAIEKFWIPRSALLTVLTREIESPEKRDKIKIVYDSKFEGIRETNEKTFVVDVTVQSKESGESLPASCVLGCDGLNSGT